MTTGFILNCHDNDSSAFEDRDDVRRCKHCGLLTAKWEETLQGLKIRKNRKADISCTYDGVDVVSLRFKEVCQKNRLTDVVFIPLPNDPDFFRIDSTRIVKFDPKPAETRFENKCPVCGQFESIVGATPTKLKRGSKVPNRGFAKTDLEFASNDEKSPLLLCGILAGELLEKSKLRGLELEPF